MNAGAFIKEGHGGIRDPKLLPPPKAYAGEYGPAHPT